VRRPIFTRHSLPVVHHQRIVLGRTLSNSAAPSAESRRSLFGVLMLTPFGANNSQSPLLTGEESHGQAAVPSEIIAYV
jgi:hypothetical protein